MMKAMILCAGYGKRLNPLTLTCPKPLLKIGNETLLSNTIKFLEKFGIKQIVINVHYLSEQIIDYVNKKKFDSSITIVKEEEKILDTGGGVLNAIQYFSNKPFLIINPDTIWNPKHAKELKLLEKSFSLNEKCKCSMLLIDKKKSFDKNFKGDFNLENNLISRKATDNLKYIFTGMQIIKPDIFYEFDSKIFSINKIWNKLIKKEELFGIESNADFLHVSTLEIYKSLLEKKFRH